MSPLLFWTVMGMLITSIACCTLLVLAGTIWLLVQGVKEIFA